MDAITLAELLRDLVRESDDPRATTVVVLEPARNQLATSTTAFVLQERLTNREWVVEVRLRARRSVG